MLEIDRVSDKAFWFRLRRPIYLEVLDRVLKIAQVSTVTNTLSEPLDNIFPLQTNDGNLDVSDGYMWESYGYYKPLF